ncbi:MAG: hypothetical protein GXO40_03465 [Epsilonproteobacteria bacterium]|nr:hypothetical protein [Campylobacterota bacterium]
MINAVLLLIMLILGGCGTSVNLLEYKPQPLSVAKYVPPKEQLIHHSLPKVVVANVDDNGIRIAKKANLGRVMTVEVVKNLSLLHSVRVIQRLKALSYKDIKKEIKAASLAKKTGLNIGADYIILGKLSNASYDYNFHEGYCYTINTKKLGLQRICKSPSVDYKACVDGDIKILKLPSLTEAQLFTIHKCVYQSEDIRSPRYIRKINNGLLRRAATQAIDSLYGKFRDFFAQKGYIYALRKKGDDIIVQTTLGAKFGAKEGDEVEIYHKERFFNPLTQQYNMTNIKIGYGIISNQITDEYSWVIVKKLQKPVKAGDFVKLKFDDSILGFIKKLY